MNDASSGSSDSYELYWRATPDLIGVMTASGLFESTNPAWFTTLGYTAPEIETRQFIDFVHPDDHEKTLGAFVTLQQGNPLRQFENRYRHKDGSYRWLSWNCASDAGRFLCTARDVTDDKKNQATLKSRDEEALLREQFIAVLGHDLRNPLAAVRAGLSMLAREPLSDRGTTVVAESEKAVARMFALITDLMDFARARLGSGISLDMDKCCDLRTALEDIVGEIQAAHPQARISCEVEVEGEIRCDLARLCQMTSNLVANAVTHGGDGPIALRARGTPEFLTISVRNSGTPIPETIRAHLFEPFVRELEQTSQEGLGLGLFICSEIARAHGGKLEVKSDEDETVFTFIMGAPADGELIGWS